MARHRKLTQKFAGFPMFKLGTSGDTFPVTSPFTTGFTGYGDGLSLDLQFATDKTLTARKGPTPVFIRGSTGTFVGSNGLIQSAAINAPRFDHDPITLACKGLLIEESRTNVVLQSETIGTTWTQTNISVSSNVAVSPDGGTTADKIVENTASAIHGIDQSTTFTAIPYTFSFYAKKDGRIWVRAFLSGLASTWFDIDNGTLGTVASGFTASITNAGNGWWRCSITGTASAGTLSSGVRLATGDGVSTYLGDGTSGVFLWGAQVEAGSFPTSYIPTTTGPLARSADVCSITGSAFSNLWNTSGGTFLFEGFLIPSTAINLRMLSSGSNRRWLYGNQSGVGTVAETLTLFDGTSTPNYFANVRIAVKFKIAISVEALTCKASFNGSAISTVSQNGNLLNSVTLLGLFENASGFITGVKYYRKNLSNQKLQTLTAP